MATNSAFAMSRSIDASKLAAAAVSAGVAVIAGCACLSFFLLLKSAAKNKLPARRQSHKTNTGEKINIARSSAPRVPCSTMPLHTAEALRTQCWAQEERRVPTACLAAPASSPAHSVCSFFVVVAVVSYFAPSVSCSLLIVNAVRTVLFLSAALKASIPSCQIAFPVVFVALMFAFVFRFCERMRVC